VIGILITPRHPLPDVEMDCEMVGKIYPGEAILQAVRKREPKPGQDLMPSQREWVHRCPDDGIQHPTIPHGSVLVLPTPDVIVRFFIIREPTIDVIDVGSFRSR
jgi:hypothetical protein